MNLEKSGIKTEPNYYVSEHYLYSDFICPCCDLLRVVPAFYRHIGLLEKMRQELGKGIIVSSGYRCEKHNKTIGGAPKSWHLLFATDIKPEDGDIKTLNEMYHIAVAVGFGGIGRYEKHLHIDLRPEKVYWRG